MPRIIASGSNYHSLDLIGAPQKKFINCSLALHGKSKIIFQFCNNVPMTFFYHLPKSFGHKPKDNFRKANSVQSDPKYEKLIFQNNKELLPELDHIYINKLLTNHFLTLEKNVSGILPHKMTRLTK